MAEIVVRAERTKSRRGATGNGQRPQARGAADKSWIRSVTGRHRRSMHVHVVRKMYQVAHCVMWSTDRPPMPSGWLVAWELPAVCEVRNSRTVWKIGSHAEGGGTRHNRHNALPRQEDPPRGERHVSLRPRLGGGAHAQPQPVGRVWVSGFLADWTCLVCVVLRPAKDAEFRGFSTFTGSVAPAALAPLWR